MAVTLSGAACGGGSGGSTGATGETLSGSEWAQRADALCGRVAADVAELDAIQKGQEILSGSGSDEEKRERVAELLDEQLRILDDFREQVEALGTPSTGAEDVEQIVEQTRLAVDELARAITALRDGDQDEFTQAMQRYAGFALESAEIARDSELDFAVCGAGA